MISLSLLLLPILETSTEEDLENAWYHDELSRSVRQEYGVWLASSMSFPSPKSLESVVSMYQLDSTHRNRMWSFSCFPVKFEAISRRSIVTGDRQDCTKVVLIRYTHVVGRVGNRHQNDGPLIIEKCIHSLSQNSISHLAVRVAWRRAAAVVEHDVTDSLLFSEVLCTFSSSSRSSLVSVFLTCVFLT